MTLAVQIREDGPWHATQEGAAITHCGKRQPWDGWVEFKPAQFALNEKWCTHRLCTQALNKAL